MITRVAVKSRAISLANALKSSTGTRLKVLLKDITDLVIDQPQSAEIFRVYLNKLIQLSQDKDEKLGSNARQALAVIGYARPPQGPGIRVLSIDGGGTRGLVSLEILRHIERITNKRIHELFDLICGVSSGAIITMGVGSGRFTIDQCESFYRDMSENIFKSDFWTSTPRLLLNHAFYDASVFEKFLKRAFGDTPLLKLVTHPDGPKLAAVSVNAHTVRPFLFRNYCQNPWFSNLFDGTCSAEVWQAIRASSAAPGYFEEFKFNSSILLDGSMLVNNCTGIAFAEANTLWPREAIQCVVSVGSGKFKPIEFTKVNATSLFEKAYGLIYSATDTETLHMVLSNLIGNYYRFNPQLSENLFINENRKLKLDLLSHESRQYMTSNDLMLGDLAEKLLKPRPMHKKILDKFITIE